MKSICVFCGASAGLSPAYTEAARELGHTLATRGLKLIYGGGRVGLMGVVADAALEAGGEVTGIIPKMMISRELEHRGLTELHEVDSMHARKALMETLSDAFVVLPGGFGTLDETLEILTWAQLGLHAKPIGVLNIANYYDGLLTFLDHATHEQFINVESRRTLRVAMTAGTLLDFLARG